MAKYKPIVARNTCFKSVESTVKENNLDKTSFGNRPYPNAMIVIRIADTVK